MVVTLTYSWISGNFLRILGSKPALIQLKPFHLKPQIDISNSTAKMRSSQANSSICLQHCIPLKFIMIIEVRSIIINTIISSEIFKYQPGLASMLPLEEYCRIIKFFISSIDDNQMFVKNGGWTKH